MNRSSLLLSAFFASVLLGSALSGCGPNYVRGTEIEYTPERQAVADVVDRYRQALEQRDVETLRALVSENYYENGSTTDDPADDYSLDGLTKVFADIKNSVKEIKLAMTIKAIDVMGEQAVVDYEYQGQYLFTVGEQDHWATAADKNRLALIREANGWRIVSGL